MSRDEETFQPKPYVNKLPESLAGRQVHRARPDARHRRFAGAHVPAAARARRHRHDHRRVRARRARGHRSCSKQPASTCTIFTAAVDERLNEHAFIVPGLGDAGDRQFGSPADRPERVFATHPGWSQNTRFAPTGSGNTRSGSQESSPGDVEVGGGVDVDALAVELDLRLGAAGAHSAGAAQRRVASAAGRPRRTTRPR